MPCTNRDDESVGSRDQVIKVRLTLEELALIDLKRSHISRSEFLRNLGLDRKTRSVKSSNFLRYQLAALHILNSIYIKIQSVKINDDNVLAALAQLSRVEAILLNEK